MTSVSISQLKTNPNKAISKAHDYPLAIEKRSQVEAYLIGKNLYEKMVSYIEDYIDEKAVKETDPKDGKDFDAIAEELGI